MADDTDNTTKETTTSLPPSFFAGWRPLLGWIVATGFFIQFIGMPITAAVMACLGHPITLPSLDTGPLVSLTTGVLGLSGLRTIEKITNSSGNH